MASSFGLELVFQSAVPSLNKKADALIVLLHWKLISNGYKCLGLNTETAGEGSEILPIGWSSNSEFYQLVYKKDSDSHILKGIIVGNQLIITFVRVKDEEVSSITLDQDTQIGENFKNYQEAFINRADLDAILDKELVSPFAKKKKEASAQTTTETTPQREVLRTSNPLEDPRFSARREQFPDPFSVGRGDLDPFAAGSGGMLMDPRHGGRPRTYPTGPFPPGAVPPGARYYPVGPEPPEQFPPNPFGTPRPRGGFGEPNPDHLPPPGSDDMFM